MIQTVTEAGERLLANALAGDFDIEYTRCEVGSGTFDPDTMDAREMTRLVQSKLRLNVAEVRKEEWGVAVVCDMDDYQSTPLHTLDPEYELPDGMPVSELGVWAKAGGTEVLFAYAYDPTPEVVSNDGGTYERRFVSHFAMSTEERSLAVEYSAFSDSLLANTDEELDETSNRPVRNCAVTSELALKAPLESPVFTGTPMAPTPQSGAARNVVATAGYVADRVKDVTASKIVDGNDIKPSSVEATGAVKGSDVSDSVGTLAALRESVSQAYDSVVFDGNWTLYNTSDKSLQVSRAGALANINGRVKPVESFDGQVWRRICTLPFSAANIAYGYGFIWQDSTANFAQLKVTGNTLSLWPLLKNVQSGSELTINITFRTT